MKQLNPLYLQEDILVQLKESFTSSTPNIIHLPNFLASLVYEDLLKESEKVKGTHQKVADKYSFTQLELKGAEFLHSKEFLSFLSKVTSKKLKKISLQIKQFAHHDYTLLHDSQTVGKQLEFFILLMNTWDNRWGGHTVYVAEKEEPILFPLQGNSFSLVNKPKNRHKFIQYVNHYAGSEKMVIIQGVVEEY